MSRPGHAATVFLAEAADQAAAGVELLGMSTGTAAHEDLRQAAHALGTLTHTAGELARHLTSQLGDYDSTRILHDNHPAHAPADRLDTATTAVTQATEQLDDALDAIHHATRGADPTRRPLRPRRHQLTPLWARTGVVAARVGGVSVGWRWSRTWPPGGATTAGAAAGKPSGSPSPATKTSFTRSGPARRSIQAPLR